MRKETEAVFVKKETVDRIKEIRKMFRKFAHAKDIPSFNEVVEIAIEKYFHRVSEKNMMYVTNGRKEQIWRDQKFRCYYCGKGIKKEDMTVDHKNPKSRGGDSSPSNVVIACFSCNNKKGDRTEMEFKGLTDLSTILVKALTPTSPSVGEGN